MANNTKNMIKDINTKRPYRFYSTQPQSWEFIERRFEQDFGGLYTRMGALIQHIRQVGLSDRLFAYSSMDKLVVSNDELIDPYKEALHVHFDLFSGKWHFSYFAVPFKPAEFERYYPAEVGIEKFDQFLKMIRW